MGNLWMTPCGFLRNLINLPKLSTTSRGYDRPMDFADATLVYLAKRESLSTILTVDHADFETYRIEGKRRFRVLPAKRP